MRVKILSFCASLLCIAAVAEHLHYERHVEPPKKDEASDKEAAAREKFAFQSLRERLPKGKPIPLGKPFSPEAAERWSIFDGSIEHGNAERAELLKALHERTRKFFVESKGFGPQRRLISDEEILMNDGWVRDPRQPGVAATFPESPGEPLTTVQPDRDHYLYHEGAALRFFEPTTLGYVKDRDHVAGFKPHGFLSIGDYMFKPLKYQYVQLIGILVHEVPVVYLSDELPSMEQVRAGKTRPLDLFEGYGLDAFRAGEDLYIAAKGDAVRMVGALRATTQCIKCHDAEQGDLLGAFSYTLRPAPPKATP